MKRLVLILCLIGLTGCGALALSQVRLAQSSLGRLAPSSAAQADVPVFTAAEQNFAFDLYRQLAGSSGNLIFSPHSLYLNLTMDYAGAGGETARQMASVLHVSLPPERLHAAANVLDQDLSAAGAKDSAFQLSVVNGLWAQQDYDFKPTYLDLLAQNYGTGLRLVDYTGDKPRQQALLAINQWASDQTHGKITDLVVPQALNDKTRLVLASTVYFNAEWLDRFEASTGSPIFTLSDGSQVSVPFISSERRDNQGHSIMDTGRYPWYVYNNEVNVVRVSYKGGRVIFVALMPQEKYPLASLEASLTPEKLKAMLTVPAQHYDLFVEMPKFSFESPLVLSDSLKALGMTDAFNDNLADFSAITQFHKLLISTVAQKSYIRVNELGTEAASGGYSGFVDIVASIAVTLNRPFIFLILDQPTGAILFMGRLSDPR
jgi:serpin B